MRQQGKRCSLNEIALAAMQRLCFITFITTLVSFMTAVLVAPFASADIEPVRYSAYTSARNLTDVDHAGIKKSTDSGWIKIGLALKRYANSGAQPLLLVHGLGQNDRIWDSPINRFNFAKSLHAAGFDVWIGNLRNAGTAGFRSDTLKQGSLWSIEDYGLSDLESLIETVTDATGQKPYFIGHSLAAWAIESYLSGLEFDHRGGLNYSLENARKHADSLKGIISIAGVYRLNWPVLFPSVISNSQEFYQSNYEFEISSRIPTLFWALRGLKEVPLNWIETLVHLPVNEIPLIGSLLGKFYESLEESITRSPLLSLFFYSKNSDHQMIKAHASDGMEAMAPKLLEQLANSYIDEEPRTYFERNLFPFIRKEDNCVQCYSYFELRKTNRLPILFIGGDKDRLANVEMIYNDGYLRSMSLDKTFVRVKDAGHLDIITGYQSQTKVISPIIQWLKSHR